MDATSCRRLEVTRPGWNLRLGDGYAIHVDEAVEGSDGFAGSVVEGLSARPKWLHCRWLYDDVGSTLYERITEQPEYYLTRVEDEILRKHAASVRRRVGNASIVELGSGSSSKTRPLLDAWTRAGSTRYLPIDISGDPLERACAELARAYPMLHVEGIVASYEHGLPLVGEVSPMLLVFLGSTVGNLNDAELDRFFGAVAANLRRGDHFLLGIDLVKDHATLEAAYNDEAGWTAKFTTNIWGRMNRELGTSIPLEAVEHVARYNEDLERIEIYNRFREAADIELGEGRRFHIEAGESIFIEISRKFHVEGMARRAEGFGFGLEHAYTDDDRFFAVLLFRKQGVDR